MVEEVAYLLEAGKKKRGRGQSPNITFKVMSPMI
jgi:hypothetical protein